MRRSGKAAELLFRRRHRRRLGTEFDRQKRVVEGSPVDRREGPRILSQRGEHVFRPDHRGALRRVEDFLRQSVPHGEGAVIDPVHPVALLLPLQQRRPVLEQPDQPEHPIVDGAVVAGIQLIVGHRRDFFLRVAVEFLPDGVDGGKIEHRHFDLHILPRCRRSFRRRQKRRSRQQGGNP